MWHKHWTENIYVGQWPIFHCPGSSAFADYLMDKCHNWATGSMWCKDLPVKMYVGQWSRFHGPVILSYILKTIWWINVVLWHKHWTETIYAGQWPIFHGPVILLYILKTNWWANVIIGILDPCDAKINHIKCMWVNDLHFVVHWFWHILKTFWWRNVGLKVLI